MNRQLGNINTGRCRWGREGGEGKMERGKHGEIERGREGVREEGEEIRTWNNEGSHVA